MSVGVTHFFMAIILFLWRNSYGEYHVSYGGYRISYGDNQTSHGEYRICYGEYAMKRGELVANFSPTCEANADSIKQLENLLAAVGPISDGCCSDEETENLCGSGPASIPSPGPLGRTGVRTTAGPVC
jgi:hypothetical protein